MTPLAKYIILSTRHGRMPVVFGAAMQHADAARSMAPFGETVGAGFVSLANGKITASGVSEGLFMGATASDQVLLEALLQGGEADKPALPAKDVIPPTVAIVPPADVKGGWISQFTVTYSDPSGIDPFTPGVNDLVVRGPGGKVYAAALAGLQKHPDGNITATYAMAAPGGAWDKPDNGLYTVALQANQVADKAGNFALERVLGTFRVEAK